MNSEYKFTPGMKVFTPEGRVGRVIPSLTGELVSVVYRLEEGPYGAEELTMYYPFELIPFDLLRVQERFQITLANNQLLCTVIGFIKKEDFEKAHKILNEKGIPFIELGQEQQDYVTKYKEIILELKKEQPELSLDYTFLFRSSALAYYVFKLISEETQRQLKPIVVSVNKTIYQTSLLRFLLQFYLDFEISDTDFDRIIELTHASPDSYIEAEKFFKMQLDRILIAAKRFLSEKGTLDEPHNY